MKTSHGERAQEDARLRWRPIPAWSWMLVAVAVVSLTAFLITAWLLVIAGHAAAGTDLANARLDAVRTGLAAGAGAGAAVGLMLAFRRQHHQEIVTILTDRDATERRITELYTKAVEQLGSEKAPIRLGGLYALERLAQDNPLQRPTIVNVICAYLRMPFAPASPKKSASSTDNGNDFTNKNLTIPQAWQQESQVRLTAQQILVEHLYYPEESKTSIKAEYARYWPGVRLNLVGATLVDLDLSTCILGEANFDEVTFVGDAYFEKTSFMGTVTFKGATFAGRAIYDRANFHADAQFNDATFIDDAHFNSADFVTTAQFDDSTFNSVAWFTLTDFKSGATFYGATFNDCAWFSQSFFHGYASFARSTFNQSVGFTQSTFTAGASFDEANFYQIAWFSQLRFDPSKTKISFERVHIAMPEAEHVWPRGWRIVQDGNGKCSVVREESPEKT